MNSFSHFLLAVDAGDDDAAEALVQQLTHQDEVALLALCDDTSVDRRWWGVRALAQIASQIDLETTVDQTLIQVLHALHDTEPRIRAAAALALAHLHPHITNTPNAPNITPPYLVSLAECLYDDDGMVRQAATDALARCGDDALSTLADILQNNSPQPSHQAARTRASMALRRMASMPAAAILFRYLNDTNYLVHTYAHEGLEELGLLENLLLAV